MNFDFVSGCQDEDAFWQKMSDIICLDEDTGLLEPQQDSLDVPMDVFVKATEEARRERILAIEAGLNKIYLIVSNFSLLFFPNYLILIFRHDFLSR